MRKKKFFFCCKFHLAVFVHHLPAAHFIPLQINPVDDTRRQLGEQRRTRVLDFAKKKTLCRFNLSPYFLMLAYTFLLLFSFHPKA